MFQVYKCGDFQVDADVVEEFLQAPTRTIPEAIVSPNKKRLSLFGNIKSVSVPIL